MTVDVSTINSKIDNMSKRFDNVEASLKDHECRIRDQEINGATKSDYKEILKEVNKINLKVERTAIYNSILLILIMFVMHYIFKV